MDYYWFNALISVIIVSLISLIGTFTISIKQEKLNKFLIYLVSFSAGALLGDVFIHLLPEIIDQGQFNIFTSLYILSGIVVSFFIEKIICWHHCRIPEQDRNHIHRFAYMNLIGDSIHNFIDGVIIAGSFLVSLPTGIGTAVAVILHEIPQEIGDFGVLLHAGMSRPKALTYNFLTATSAILGTALTLIMARYLEHINLFLIPFAAGSFIYIAAVDLIPELHKELELKKGMLQMVAFIAGIGVMMLLLLVD